MLPLARAALRRLGPAASSAAAADGTLPVRLLLLAPLSSKSSAAAPPEYQMPSVTWGVIQGRKERLVSRVLALDFLRSAGVSDPAGELEAVELPSSLDVLQERLDFLLRLGLSTDDLSAYPFLLACSLRKNIIPVLSYLEKLGVTRARLAAFVRAYPACLHASVAVDLAPIVKALRGLDVDREDIPRVLERYPDVLGLKPDGTISTSVAYLVGIVGVAPRDIGPMVTHYPFFLSMRVGTTIKPLCDYITSLGLPIRILARIIEKRPYILGYDLEETVKPNVEALLSFGIRKEVLPLVIAHYPSILGLPLKVKLAAQQYFFNLKLKIDPDGFARAVEKLPQLVSLHQNVILKPVEFLRGRGITDEDVGRMLVRCPQILLLRNELMKNSFYFFKSELKRPISELLEFPEYFTYSLESRIKPRYMRVASKGIRCSLDWFLNCSDQRFEERMRGDFIEGDAPGPSFTMGGKLQMPGSQLVSDDDNDDSDDEVLYRRTVML
ncbi:transcription termination factor MTERF4, chloroplastic-like [Lolium rigidum]|uniref:transcription termination factor MTERF4, chloroplastic-like n=1 Tax=Lolium rigidum TaxID=89674 RepID=UPI001F5DBDF4|nr:transcription termination factor MTERF4, chloroplastic-like [Lolium rigidum]